MIFKKLGALVVFCTAIVVGITSASAELNASTFFDLFKRDAVTDSPAVETFVITDSLSHIHIEELRSIYKREIECMALNIYHEAKNQSTTGQIAVGLVVLNRVKDRRFPGDICAVILQGPVKESWKTKQDPNLDDSERVYHPKRHMCQFSWYCDGKDDTPKEPTAWAHAVHVAEKLLFTRSYAGMVDGATHYHADYVSPKWRHDMTMVTKIDDHIFYRWD